MLKIEKRKINRKENRKNKKGTKSTSCNLDNSEEIYDYSHMIHHMMWYYRSRS